MTEGQAVVVRQVRRYGVLGVSFNVGVGGSWGLSGFVDLLSPTLEDRRIASYCSLRNQDGISVISSFMLLRGTKVTWSVTVEEIGLSLLCRG